MSKTHANSTHLLSTVQQDKPSTHTYYTSCCMSTPVSRTLDLDVKDARELDPHTDRARAPPPNPEALSPSLPFAPSSVSRTLDLDLRSVPEIVAHHDKGRRGGGWVDGQGTHVRLLERRLTFTTLPAMLCLLRKLPASLEQYLAFRFLFG